MKAQVPPIGQAQLISHRPTLNHACSRVKANISDISGCYVIDPDGIQGNSPFQVYCNMTDKGGVGVTVVSHDTEKRTHVKGYEDEGSYSRNIIYNGVSLSQLEVRTSVSAFCEQFIRYECKKAKLLRDGKGWWVASNGQKMEYWGGATGSKSGCGCAVTKTCSDPKELCNCDINDNKWREAKIVGSLLISFSCLFLNDGLEIHGVNKRKVFTLWVN